MGKGLIAIGIMFWVLEVTMAYIFITPKKDRTIDRIKASIQLCPAHGRGPWVNISLLQITAIYWVLIGILLNVVGNVWPSSFTGDIILFGIIGLPLIIGAIIVERRKSP